MKPRTDRIPKFLLSVAGRPFGAWLVERLAAAGFSEVVLCVGHLGEAIHAAMGDRFAGLPLRYTEDGPTLLGTAGALRRALELLAPTFLVTYGDSYLPFDYQAPLRDLEAHPDALGTMAVYRNEGHLDASNTAVSGDRVVRYEKRRGPEPELDPLDLHDSLDHIDYGATALRREVIAALPAGAPLGFDAVQRDLAASGRLRALPVAERFHEIGSERGLLDLEAVLQRADGAGAGAVEAGAVEERR